ncbi:pyridoxal kinase [Tepiditoga spiralis]|uniref:pyridoxal kinase n=1 Tax=Tepiditoga spiralis TaxID=2108365 RepID=A0A7G1G5D2_9BACT|nr:pyridoxamine kinase [Tepiditoga spiralis]BBE31325.1 pyridoxal kinase [Tepiditoga spiralis]
MTGVKKVAAIHDLSGFGRCSLTVIIPTLSTLGIQVCPIPTAILSTHTDGFGNDFSFVDLTDSMKEYIKHWKTLNLKFDGIYSGFLGSENQIEIISDFIDKFKTKNTLVVIDPVMADNGELYQTMSNSMVEKMKKLIKKANIITPNFTEACYLLNETYKEKIEIKEIKNWLIRLTNEGPEIAIITSIPIEREKNTVIAYSKNDKRFWMISSEQIPAFYPGTGDIFSSIVTGRILNGDSLPVAIDRAVIFIKNAIKESFGFDYPHREGILLEKVLNNLNLPYTNSNYKLI